MRASSLLLIIPILWTLATAFTQVSGHPWSSNRATLKSLGTWIAKFQKEYSRLPESLAEVRTYAFAQGEKPALYDSYGNRLFYQTLTDTSYLLKSFGRDAAENTVLLSRDESVSKGLIFPPPGIQGDTPNESRLHFYQSAYLDGLESPRGPLTASLKSRARTASKRLLIQSRAEDNFFMVSSHDAVEEFLWLPGGYEILFTAQGSSRYEDGLYYWNLTTHQLINLLPKFKEKYFPSLKEDAKFYIALSHVSLSPTFAYIFVAPVADQLDPRAFYRYQNFFALNPRNDFAMTRVAADNDYSIFDYPVSAKALIEKESTDKGTSAQKDWMALSLSGDKQTLLETWQTYCTNHSDREGASYSIWWLASLYNDTYKELLRTHPEKARIIRNYGLEISEALISLPYATHYLRGFAEYLKKNLLLSKPGDYNVASAGQEPDDSAVKIDEDKPEPAPTPSAP